MADPLAVHVSRSDLHAIETPESYDASGPFTVAITNHGRDAHVHLKLDDALARVADLEGDGNYYVERDETRRVRVDVSPQENPVGGTVKVETGYGAESVRVGVTVAPPEEDVAVGADVGTAPADPDRDRDEEDGGIDLSAPGVPEGTLPIATLAVIALAIAGLVAMSVDSPVVIAGVAVVMVGILAAAVMLVR